MGKGRPDRPTRLASTARRRSRRLGGRILAFASLAWLLATLPIVSSTFLTGSVPPAGAVLPGACSPTNPAPCSEPQCSATVPPPCIFQNFEIDGNTAVDTTGGAIDWATPPPNVTHFNDGTVDFSNGSKENDQSTWSCAGTSAPPKDDLASGGNISFRNFTTTSGAVHQVMDVNFTRVDGNGDAHVDYEFNQSTQLVSSASCASAGLPVRTAGDILMTLDSSNGGATLTVAAFRFNGTSFVGLPTGSLGTTFEGTENGITNNTVSPPVTTLSDPGQAPGTYGEAGLDLTATIGNFACGQFATAYMKSRSSTSISSEAKDITQVLPFNPGSCPKSSLVKGARDFTTNPTGMFTPTVNASPGDTIQYQLVYTNSGSADATGVVVTDPVPADSTFQGCTPSTICSQSGGTITWNVGTVGANSSTTLGFTVKLNSTFPAGQTSITNTAHFTNNQEVPGQSNTVTVTVTAAPKSTLTKAARDDTTNPTGAFAASITANPGDTIEYQLVYTNSGNAAASGVSVSDPLPADSTFLSCTPIAICSFNGTTITWNVGTVAASGSVTLGFTDKLASTFPTAGPTQITNTAVFSNSQGESGSSNPVTVTVNPQPISSLVKGARDDTTNPNGMFTATVSASPGDTIQYQLVYSNSGSAPATGVVVSDPLPPDSTFQSCTPIAICSFNGTTITWNVGTVNPGNSVTLGFTDKLASTFPAGQTPVTNTAVFSNSQGQSGSSNPVTVTVTAAPISTLTKAARDDTTNAGGAFAASISASPGDTIEYQLVYTNSGNAPATGVVVSDPLPADSTFVSCTPIAICSFNGTTITWNVGTVNAGTSVTLGFTDKLNAVFPAGQTQVTNTAVFSNSQGQSGGSNPVTVTVTAAPKSSLTKGARDDTTNPTGAFTTTITAGPGDTIEYQVVFTNSGNAAATGVVVTDPVPAHSTFQSCTPTTICSVSGSTITWNVGTVNAGTSVTLGFIVKLNPTFPAGCGTQITNTASFTDNQGESGMSSPVVTVTVCATPNLGLLKSAPGITPPVVNGQSITYNIAYFNTGNGDLTTATINDTVPANTVFVSCSGGTTCSQSGGTVTWTVGPVPAGTSAANPAGTVSFVVKVSNTSSCMICNTASISSPLQNNGTPVLSNQLCFLATPAANPAGAHANGSAYGAHVGVTPLGINQTLIPVSSTQTGVGTNSQSNSLLTVDIPSSGTSKGNDLHADALRSTSTSNVTAAPPQADQKSTSEAVGLCLLKVSGACTVSADLVEGVAHTVATGSASSFDSAGSTVSNVVVDGVLQVNVTPNFPRINLPSAVFGANSYVDLYHTSGSTSSPAAGTLSGGTYAADATTDMVHLVATSFGVDITVGHTVAHSDFPQTVLCAATPLETVSGEAFIASEIISGILPPGTVGEVDIPTTGGDNKQDLLTVVLPSDGSAVTAGASTSESKGVLGTPTTSESHATAANVCVLKTSKGVCPISATAVQSVASSTANGTSATSSTSSTDFGATTFTGLVINGNTISLPVPANTTITLPGLGFVVLNEQFCDNSASLSSCSGTTHSGLTVRAIDVVINQGVLAGTEIIVAEAHSDATHF